MKGWAMRAGSAVKARSAGSDSRGSVTASSKRLISSALPTGGTVSMGASSLRPCNRSPYSRVPVRATCSSRRQRTWRRRSRDVPAATEAASTSKPALVASQGSKTVKARSSFDEVAGWTARPA